MPKTIEQLMAAFQLRDLQNLVTAYDWLKQNGRTIEDLRHYLAGKPREMARPAQGAAALWNKKAPRCPRCGAPLLLREINLKPGRGNENGYRSEWHCTNGDCIYEKYDRLTVSEQLNRHGLKNLARSVRRCGKER